MFRARQRNQNIKPSRGSSEHGALDDYTGHTPMNLAWLPPVSSVDSQSSENGRPVFLKHNFPWSLVCSSILTAQYTSFSSESERKSLSSVWLFCDPMDCRPSLPGSSMCRIPQVRILEWVAIPFSRGFSQPRDRTQVSCIAGRLFTVWATSGTSYFPDSQSEKCFPIHSGLLHAELDVGFSIRHTQMRQTNKPLPS